MFSRILRIGACGITIAAVACFAVADTVYLKDGKTLQGTVERRTVKGPQVAVRTTAGVISVPQQKIARVELEDEAVGHVEVAGQHLRMKKYHEAAAEYRLALNIDPNVAGAAEGLKQAEAELARIGDAQKQAQQTDNEAILKAAKQLVDEKKFEEAYALVKPLNLASDPRYDKLVAEGAYKWALDLIDRQMPARAVELLQVSLQKDPTNHDARNKLLTLWGDDPTKLNQVIAATKDSSDPQDQLKAADALFRSKKYEDALRIYVTQANTPGFVNSPQFSRMKQAFEIVQTDYATRQQFDKAAFVYQHYLKFWPDADPVPLARYEVLIKAKGVDMGNADQVVELANYATERGFGRNAVDLYNKALALKPGHAGALEGLRRQAAIETAEFAALLHEGQFDLASGKANEISSNFKALPDVVKLVNEMRAQAQQQIAQAAAAGAQQARVLVQRGDEYWAQAQQYLGWMSNQDYSENVRVVSPKSEASKYCGMALQAWKTALSMDPSVADPLNGDLSRKISEATSLYTRLNATTSYRPDWDW
jgi:hypothetical protein